MANLSLVPRSISIPYLAFMIHRSNSDSPGTAANQSWGCCHGGKVLLLSAPAVHSNQPRTLGNSLVMLLISVQSRGAGRATKSQCKLELSPWGLTCLPSLVQTDGMLKQGSTLEVPLPLSSTRDFLATHLSPLPTSSPFSLIHQFGKLPLKHSLRAGTLWHWGVNFLITGTFVWHIVGAQ